MKNNFILFIVFILVLSSFVYSTQPTVVVEEDFTNIFIDVPPFDYYEYEQDISIYVQPHNESSGLLLFSPDVECDIYVSDRYNILYNNSMSFKTDYFITILNDSIITKKGGYAYKVYCNTSNKGGTVVAYFEVNDYGTRPNDNDPSIGIIIFLLLLNIALFYLPSKVSFSKSKPTDYTMKNITYVLAWLILTFNTTIFITLAENTGLGITRELFVFQWFFLKAIYILCIVIILKTMLLVPKLLKEQKMERRMGKDER